MFEALMHILKRIKKNLTRVFFNMSAANRQRSFLHITLVPRVLINIYICPLPQTLPSGIY